MARHTRQRFERSDVPTKSRGRTVGAIVALLVVAAMCAVVVGVLWHFAQQGSTVGDTSLAAAVSDADAAEAPAGYARSGDEFENVLFLIVDDPSSSNPGLRSARLACLNTTAQLGYLVDLPIDVAMGQGGETLAQTVASEGSAAGVTAVSQASGMPVNHVIVISQAGFDSLLSMAASGASDLMGAASELLGSMVTDMDAFGLVSLAETLRGIGVGNLSVQDAPLAGDGSIDADAFGVAVGYLVVA